MGGQRIIAELVPDGTWRVVRPAVGAGDGVVRHGIETKTGN